ncbi:hypothetical protein GCM10010399_04620 [Dactylosporangium fulvum]|uniref:DUF6401 family natural product biosynthesis protein n=1 Tax=Dactylosporangium fulvum TaxID=53359 RepID=A0ABY5VWY6_9ACTN|nr:DUF6401 family natural product biosynthesis protein [Dactylosporangium fulvum]UWP81314.1 DUF6401 family natural product biosynthesis protein [Dactylosporangium fulvum]
MNNELTPAVPAPSFGTPPFDAGSFEASHLATAELAARHQLDQVMAMVGVDGLVEALAQPFLLAKVDQHAAAVRESLTAAGKPVDAISLAGYARSVIAVHQRHGRPLPTPDSVDWTAADWTALRLVAVCHLADAAGAL